MTQSRTNRLVWGMIALLLGVIFVGCSRRPREEEGKRKRPAAQVGLPYPADTSLRKAGDEAQPILDSDVEGSVSVETRKTPDLVIEPVPEIASISQDDTNAPWLDVLALPSEHWEIQYLGGRPIGYTRYRASPSLTAETSKLRCETTSVVRLRKGDRLTEQRLTVGTLERPNGELISINVEQLLGEETTKLEGVVVGETLQWTQIKGTKRSGSRIPWKSSYRGPNAVEQSLRRKPMQPGERRRFSYFDPVLVSLVDVVLEAKDRSFSATFDGSDMELLEIRSVVIQGNMGMETRLWTDADGRIQKKYVSALDLRSFLAPESAALAVRDSADWDIMEWSTIPLNKSIEKVDQISEIAFQVRLKDQLNPANVFPTTDFQQVRSLTALTCQVTVSRPNLPTEWKIEPESPLEYRLPSEFIQSDDPQIIDVSKLFASLGSQEEHLVERLCRGVYQSVQKRPFSSSFSSAADVAYNMYGDCTEHALLFAGVARAHGLPTRIAGGLLVSSTDGKPSLVFHLWNEILVEGRWIPIDPTWGKAPAPADRIVIVQSALASSNPYGDLLPVLRAMGNLIVEIAEVRY